MQYYICMFIPYILLICYYLIGLIIFLKIRRDNKKTTKLRESVLIPNDSIQMQGTISNDSKLNINYI